MLMPAFRRLRNSFKSSINYFNRINRNIMPFIIYGLIYDAVLNLYKPFATKYLERLGGTNFHITLFNSLPGVVAVAVLLPCLFLMSRFKRKRQITAAFILLGRFIILAMAFLPVFNPELRPIIFVGLIAVLNFPEAVSQSAMQSILGSVFGGRDRAMALSTRNQFGNFFIMLVTLISGIILSYLPKTEEQRMFCYQAFFVAAFILGLIEVYYFLKMDEKNNPEYVETTDKAAKLSDLALIFKDKKFLTFAFGSILFYVSYHGGWAIYSIYTIKSLGATEIWMSIFAVAAGLTSFFTAPFWSRYISKKGNSKALVVSCYLMGINTILTVMSPNLYFIVLQSLVGGFSVVGLNITLLNGLLISTPNENRLLYIGLYNTMVNISLGLSPLLVQLVMDRTSVNFALYMVGISRIVIATILLYVFVIRNKEAGESQE